MSLHKELTDFTIGSLTLRTPVTVQPGMPLSAAVRPVPECQLNFSFPETPWTMRVHTTLSRRSWPVCFGITPRPAKMEFAKRSAMPRYPSEALSKSVVYHETAGLASTPARSGGSLVPTRGSFARINAVKPSLPARPRSDRILRLTWRQAGIRLLHSTRVSDPVVPHEWIQRVLPHSSNQYTFADESCGLLPVAGCHDVWLGAVGFNAEMPGRSEIFD